MTPMALVEAVLQSGGLLALDGDGIWFKLPENAVHLVEGLRAHKTEVITILRSRGGRLATFPHCPKCASYALYRSNNLGNYQCQTCGMREIPEDLARRVQ